MLEATDISATPVLAPSNLHEVPPKVQLLLLVNGKRVTQVAYAVAKLGIADLLADGPRPVSELAEATGSHELALYRVLRCAAAVGVLTAEEDRRFGLTPPGELLRSDHPDSQRDLVIFNGEEIYWRPFGHILHSVQTGEPAFDMVFGKPFFEFLQDKPESSAIFHKAISGLNAWAADTYLGRYDFSKFSQIVDVGGGYGLFLAELLERVPHLKAVLFDLPEITEKAAQILDERGVGDRVDFASGSFFEEVPAGYECYMLKAVLHDWSDEKAALILRRVREAIGDNPDARLLILEEVLTPGDKWDHGKFLDVDMLVNFGGRERDAAEWEQMLRENGFELAADLSPGEWRVIETRPIVGWTGARR